LFGLTLAFDANQNGDQVCNVPEGAALDRLLGLSEGYRPYQTGAIESFPLAVETAVAPIAQVQAEQLAVEAQDEAPKALAVQTEERQILTNDTTSEEIDLSTMGREELIAVIANLGLDFTPHHKMGAKAIRAKIMEMMAEST
jgi:hypothetical protein